MSAGDAITVRVGSRADVDAWLALYEAVAAEGRWIGAEAPFDRNERRARLEATLEATDAVVLLAEVEDQVVGALKADVDRGRVTFGMVVGEHWRHQGVGSRLLSACLAWAAGQDAHKVALEVWPHNEAAIALYRKFGFVVEGRLRRHYRRRNGQLWDSLAMGLVLDVTSPGCPYGAS